LNSGAPLWLGYASGGRKFLLASPPGSLALLGRAADSAAALLAVSAHESGLAPVVLDLSGRAGGAVSGRLEALDHRSLLYDAFAFDGDDPWHGQLVAAAYSAALDLGPEDEAILSAAFQKLSVEDNTASPHSLADALQGVEGFRGFYRDKLRGRACALKQMDAVLDQEVSRLAVGGALVSFAAAPYPLAAELAASLLVAKLVSLCRSNGARPGLLVLTDSHRIFRSLPRTPRSARLLTSLLGSSINTALASSVPGCLDPLVLDSVPVAIMSSDQWHRAPLGRRFPVPSTALVLEDRATSQAVAFVPRLLVESPVRLAVPPPSVPADPALTLRILEEVQAFPTANRQALASYLSDLFLPADVRAELDRLHALGLLTEESKLTQAGTRIFAYTLTEGGLRLMNELKK
jgi:hypothetical protein